MTHYTVCCGYASHYHNTVTVEADTLDEALEKAIEQAGDDPHWKSVDQASQTFVEALAEGEDADPWGDTALPVPDRFTEKGEPPVVTLTGLRPPGGIEVAGGTVRIRFIEHAGTVTTEAADPPAPPGNKPLVTVRRRADGAPDVAVSGPCTRAHSGSRRHRTAAGRLIAGGIRPSQTACLAPLRAGGRLSARRGRPRCGCIPIIDIREDHSMKLFTEEQRTKLLANGTRRGPTTSPWSSGSTHAGPAPGCCPIPNTGPECVTLPGLIWGLRGRTPEWGQTCLRVRIGIRRIRAFCGLYRQLSGKIHLRAARCARSGGAVHSGRIWSDAFGTPESPGRAGNLVRLN